MTLQGLECHSDAMAVIHHAIKAYHIALHPLRGLLVMPICTVDGYPHLFSPHVLFRSHCHHSRLSLHFSRCDSSLVRLLAAVARGK